MSENERQNLLAAIEDAKREQQEARRQLDRAADVLTEANWKRHNAELALRRFDENKP